MTVHAVFQMHVDTPEKLTEYRAVAGEALARHGGVVAAANGAAAALDPDGGLAEAPGLLAVLTFPDADAARAWIADPAFAAAHALRNAAGKGQVWLL